MKEFTNRLSTRYWNTKSVYKGHWTAGGTSIPDEIKPFYGCSTEIKKGSLLGVYREKNGNLHFTIDSIDQGIAARNVPDTLYGFVRISASGSSGRIKVTLRSLACKTLGLFGTCIVDLFGNCFAFVPVF